MQTTTTSASPSVCEAVDAIYIGIKAAANVLMQGRHLEIDVAVSPTLAALMRQRHADADRVLANVSILGE